MAKILVTGATGQLGRQTAEFLLRRVGAEDIALLARDPSKLEPLAARGIEVRQGDYSDPASLERAFAGVEKLMFISTSMFQDVVQQHLNVVGAARTAGVDHVFYTAIQKRPNSDFVLSQVTEMDARTEEALRASGLKTTILRNGLYLDALPFMIGADPFGSALAVPAGSAAAALVARSDLAEANAILLTQDGHAGLDYDLGGAEALTMRAFASIFAYVGGADIRYVETAVEDYRARREAEGLPPFVAAFLAEWFAAISAGEFAMVSGDLGRILGRAPITVEAFLSDLFRSARVERSASG